MKSNISTTDTTESDTDTPIGCRVGAMLSADESTVRFLGYGVYEGEFLPPQFADPETMLAKMREMAPGLEQRIGLEKLLKDFEAWNQNPLIIQIFGNPRIKLDSGKTVWGYECHWGLEAKVRDYISGRQIIEVDIDDERAAAAVTRALDSQPTDSRN